jgi:putative transposase
MKELQTENRRLRALVNRLTERLNEAVADVSPDAQLNGQIADAPAMLASKASEQMRGASLGRFASVRGTR